MKVSLKVVPIEKLSFQKKSGEFFSENLNFSMLLRCGKSAARVKIFSSAPWTNATICRWFNRKFQWKIITGEISSTQINKNFRLSRTKISRRKKKISTTTTRKPPNCVSVFWKQQQQRRKSFLSLFCLCRKKRFFGKRVRDRRKAENNTNKRKGSFHRISAEFSRFVIFLFLTMNSSMCRNKGAINTRR